MKRTADKQRGFVLVVIAGLLIVLIGFVGLGVDTGALYSARTKAQSAADAAALAGAFTFVVKPTDPLPAATAIAAGKAVALKYIILGKPVLTGDVDVVPDVANRKVAVTVRTAQPTYFMKALGLASADIEVHALAEAGNTSSQSPGNPKPFFLPNTVLSPQDPCMACSATPPQILIDPATGTVTPWAKAQYGAAMSIKPTDPHSALEPSEFYLLDFDNKGGGATELSDWIDGTVPVPPVACGKLIEVEKGNKVGLKHGLENLLGDLDDPDDVYVDVGQYAINGGAISDVSKALVTVPVWDTCAPGMCTGNLPHPPGGGLPKVPVIGWAVVFLVGGDDPLLGRLINVSPCAGGGGGGASSGSGSEVVGGFPLRLVR